MEMYFLNRRIPWRNLGYSKDLEKLENSRSWWVWKFSTSSKDLSCNVEEFKKKKKNTSDQISTVLEDTNEPLMKILQERIVVSKSFPKNSSQFVKFEKQEDPVTRDIFRVFSMETT